MLARLSSNEALTRAGLGRRYAVASWDEISPALLEPCRAYCEDLPRHVADGRGLVLVGGVGTGKSHAMALVADRALDHQIAWARTRTDDGDGELLTRPCAVEWVAAPVLYRILHRPGDGDNPERIGEFERADMLFIDDFDRLYAHEWQVMQFEALMEVRYSERRATCMTLNSLRVLQVPDLERTLDRLEECSVVVLLGDEVRSRRRSA